MTETSNKGRILKQEVNNESNMFLYILGNFKLFLFIFSLFIIIVFYFFIAAPLLKQIKLNKIEVKNKKAEIEIQNKLKEQKKLTTENYQNLKKYDWAKLEKMTPTGDNRTADFLIQLNYIAEKNKISISNYQLSQNNSVDGIGILFINSNQSFNNNESFRKVGSSNYNIIIKNVEYNNLKSFIKDLEKNLRLIDVISFSFNAKLKEAQMSLKTYFLLN